MPHPVIVVATDLSPASERCFPAAATLAASLDAELVLLHVLVPQVTAFTTRHLAPQDSRAVAVEVDAAKKRLRELAGSLAGARTRTEVLVGGDAARTINQYAQKSKAAYLVLTTHGRTGLRRVLMGSVAEAVVRTAKLPIVVVPLAGAASASAASSRRSVVVRRTRQAAGSGRRKPTAKPSRRRPAKR